MNGEKEDKHDMTVRVAKQAARQETRTMVRRFDKAVQRLEDVAPILESINHRQDRHFVWLAILTLGMVIMSFICL